MKLRKICKRGSIYTQTKSDEQILFIGAVSIIVHSNDQKLFILTPTKASRIIVHVNMKLVCVTEELVGAPLVVDSESAVVISGLSKIARRWFVFISAG